MSYDRDVESPESELDGIISIDGADINEQATSDIEAAFDSPSSEEDSGDAEEKEFKERVKKNTNQRNDASSIYMKEIGEPELKDIVGEIETSQMIEKHKNSLLFYLLLFPNVNSLVVDNFMAEKNRSCGHPKVRHYGNSEETDHYSDSITEAFATAGTIYKNGLDSPLTISSVDFAGIAKTLKLLVPKNSYEDCKVSKSALKGKIISEPDYNFFSIERFEENLQEGLISKKALSTVRKAFPIFGFHADYNYVRKIYQFFQDIACNVQSAEKRINEILHSELGYKRSEVVDIVSKSQKESFGISRKKLSHNQFSRLNLLRGDLNFSLERLGVNYRFYKDASVKVTFHKKRADSFINDMVVCNLRLVIKEAKHYNNNHIEFCDFVQEGNLGIMRAVEKYDYRRGHKFSTYSTWWVKQGITRSISDQGSIVRVPVHMAEFHKRIDRVIKDFAARGEPTPSAAMIAEILGESKVAKVELALSYGKEMVSFDTTTNSEEDDGSSLIQFFKYDDGDGIRTPTESRDSEELKQVLLSCIDRLSERDGKIILLRSGILSGVDKTLEEAGQQFDVTRERIRQLETKAFGRLREMLSEYGYGAEF